MTDGERYERGQEIVRDVEREFSGRPMQEMVEEVRARVEKLVVTEGGSYCSYLMKPVVEEPLRAEPLPVRVPEKAFPDHFYYKPEPRVIEEPVIDMPRFVAQTYKEQYERWFAPKVEEHPGHAWGPCQCGHQWEHHAPACVHYIEGCACEQYAEVPQGSVEGA